jgi:hypothetical protein
MLLCATTAHDKNNDVKSTTAHHHHYGKAGRNGEGINDDGMASTCASRCEPLLAGWIAGADPGPTRTRRTMNGPHRLPCEYLLTGRSMSANDDKAQRMANERPRNERRTNSEDIANERWGEGDHERMTNERRTNDGGQ